MPGPGAGAGWVFGCVGGEQTADGAGPEPAAAGAGAGRGDRLGAEVRRLEGELGGARREARRLGRLCVELTDQVRGPRAAGRERRRLERSLMSGLTH